MSFVPVAKGELHCRIVSTLNAGQIPPLRLRIVEEGNFVTAELLERRIRALRQAYAIAYLLQYNRAQELDTLLDSRSEVDIESTLVPEEDRLRISAAAPGSFWVTIVTNSARAYSVVKLALALPYQQGRDALLRQLHAGTRLKELAVDDKSLDVNLKRANGLIDLAKRLEEVQDPQSRSLIQAQLFESLSQLGSQGVQALPAPDRSET